MEVLLFAIVLLVSLFLIPLGLPGTWIMVGSAIGYDAIVGGDPIGWVTIAATAALAVIAEIFEFSLSARYTKKYGGSRRAGWGAIIGGIVGAIVGVPVPIIGSVIGAFVGSFAGALVDAGRDAPLDTFRGWIDESFRAVAPKRVIAALPPAAR